MANKPHMTLHELQRQALEIAAKYDEQNKQNDQKEWDASAFMAGFVGDVGDLSKLVMAKKGYRHTDDVDEKLAHELADCLWSLLILAEKLGINLEASYQKTIKELNDRF